MNHYVNAVGCLWDKVADADAHGVRGSVSGGGKAEVRGWSGTLWSWRRESNPQPADYKSAALPIELRQQAYLFSVVILPTRSQQARDKLPWGDLDRLTFLWQSKRQSVQHQ